MSKLICIMLSIIIVNVVVVESSSCLWARLLLLLKWLLHGTGQVQLVGLDPVVNVDVDELILALRLHHVVALLAESPYDAKD